IVCATPARERLWRAQTPQAFRASVLRDAYERAARTAVQATDDASLVELSGHEVHMVRGSYRNIKITTPEDLIVARALLGA
ncbi:MAG: 2-C-methyl-D-erythritol 4-phosphate cytidylyltransferase, partial [Deltaproteobacteria bacterium]|nr:2-C-methyl-D-erythritol 4-phosphate cytidylyltransferase [Deltaproteobacteria bacterium]